MTLLTRFERWDPFEELTNLRTRMDRLWSRMTPEGFRRVERSYGSFLRSFTLPTNVEPETISASFANGLLEVPLPKKEGAKPRSIKVEVKKQLATAA